LRTATRPTGSTSAFCLRRQERDGLAACAKAQHLKIAHQTERARRHDLRPRVSTDGESVAAQVKELHAAGAGKVFRETTSSAKTDRAKLRQRADALGLTIF